MREPLFVASKNRLRRLLLHAVLTLGMVFPVVAWAQQTSADPTGESPVDADTGFLLNQGAVPRFEAASKISPEMSRAVNQQRISSVPHFSSAFASGGKTFPFTIIGAPPQRGGVTEIPTQLIPLTLFFGGFVNDAGEPIVLSPGAILPKVMNSPNFRNADYQTGFTQFADAVQRAQFFRIMAEDWHTLLGRPQTLKPVVIYVPRGYARVYRNRATGALYALVDHAFFISQLNTIVQLQEMKPDALTIVLTSNVFLAPDLDLKRCCVLGFHTAFDGAETGETRQVQTLVWASWIDQGILGTSVADVTPLSHEISEWMNNPFGTNQVPAWQSPAAPGGCQSNLETADPVAALPNAGFPVPIDGFTFHPQTQVLLPWFTHGASDTIDGVLSFPDQKLVTKQSQPCAK